MKGREGEESVKVVQRGVQGLGVEYREYNSLIGNTSNARRCSQIQVLLIPQYTTATYLTVVGILSLFASLD